MRRVSLVVIVLVVLSTASAPAAQFRREREERSVFDHLIRVVRSILRMQTNGDGLTPPTPAPRP